MRRTLILTVVWLGTGGAASWAEPLRHAEPPRHAAATESTAAVSEVQERSASLNALERNYSLLACPMQLRHFVVTVRENCTDIARQSAVFPVVVVPIAAAVSASPSSAPPAATELRRAICPAQTIQDSVAYQQRMWRVRLADLLTALPHTVLYPSASVREPSSGRQLPLKVLLGTPFLRSTRLLVVVRPDRTSGKGKGVRSDRGVDKGKGQLDALERIRWTLEWLVRQGVPPNNIESPWLYDLRPSTHQQMDDPMPPETDDSGHAVWLIRVDC